jgi:hypothetical protein
MEPGTAITDLSPEVFTLIVDRLLPISKHGSRRTDALDFACLRLSSRGVRQLCDAAVRRLDLRHCGSDDVQALLHRFTGAAISNRHLCVFRMNENAPMLHVLMMHRSVHLRQVFCIGHTTSN